MSKKSFINHETFELCKLRGRRTCFSATWINQRKCLLVLLDLQDPLGRHRKGDPVVWLHECCSAGWLASSSGGLGWIVSHGLDPGGFRSAGGQVISNHAQHTQSYKLGHLSTGKTMFLITLALVPLSFWCGTTFHHRLIYFLTAKFKIFLILL